VARTYPSDFFAFPLGRSGEEHAMPRHVVEGRTPPVFQVALVCLALAVWSMPAGAQQMPPVSRVRAEDPVIAAAIALGIERSTTFGRLIEAINATDGMVYVLEGKCGLGVRACLHLSLELSGANRLLRVFVTPSRAPGCELIGSIGHELQHAVEVLSNSRIRSNAELFSFFHRMRTETPVRFETAKAVETGLTVEKEACKRPTSR
jgi:hypothetical protein